jgi:hypothetical protein
MVLVAAARAMIAELARRHRQEEPFRAFDQLDVADDEGVVEGEGAERFQTTGLPAAQIDTDFRQLHGTPQVAKSKDV